MRLRIFLTTICLLTFVLALPATALPLDTASSWWANVWTDTWTAIVSIFAGDEAEPEPETPVEEPETNSVNAPGDGGGQVRPGLDPDG